MTPSNPSPASSNEPEAAEVSEARLREIVELRNPLNALKPTVVECCEMARELLRLRSRPVAEGACPNLPWRARGTSVYFANVAGGFDVRGCPNPVELAEAIVRAANASTRPVSAGPHEAELTALEEGAQALEADNGRDMATDLGHASILRHLAARLRGGA